MSSHGDCSTKQDWNEEVENAGRWQPNEQCRVGRENVKGTHYDQAKEKLEEKLTRLVLVTTEYKWLLQEMMIKSKETDDEVGLVVKSIRTELEKGSTKPELTKEEKTRTEMEHIIMANLTELAEGQEEIKSTLKIGGLTKCFEKVTLTQRDQENEIKPPLRCYWCHEEGHMKRNCLQRIQRNQFRRQNGFWHKQNFNETYAGTSRECPQQFNRERWMSTQAFKQKRAFRHEQNDDEMHGQSRRENAQVSYNPLN